MFWNNIYGHWHDFFFCAFTDDFGSKSAAFFSGVKGDFEPPPKVTRFQNAPTFVLVGAYLDEKGMLYPYWYSLRWEKKIWSSLSVSGKFWLFLAY